MRTSVRLSIRVGPICFKISRSGTTVSAGIRGGGVGLGSRANYIRIGQNGARYVYVEHNKNQRPKQYIDHSSITHGPQVEIKSDDASLIVDSNSSDIIEEINSKNGKISLLLFAMAFSASISIYAACNNLPMLGVSIMGAILCIVVRQIDLLRKTCILAYDMDDDFSSTYESLLDSFEEMQECKKCWHINSKAKIYNKKYHAGASNLLGRSEIKMSFGSPPGIKTNIEIPKIPVGDQTLYLFPDRALIYGKGGVGAVSYTNLTLRLMTQNFIEEDRLPSDAETVGHTWRYVNKRGGPDRRFKNNYQIPIALYEYIYFSSDSGLNECLCFSALGSTSDFKDALRTLTQNANKRG